MSRVFSGCGQPARMVPEPLLPLAEERTGEETPHDPVYENTFSCGSASGESTIRSGDLLSSDGVPATPWTNFAQGMLEIDRSRTDETDRKARHA